MANLNDFVLFAQAVEQGSFAAAARRLGVPKSTVSKRVAELEARLGARLLNRTSRSFMLTDAGREVFEHARAAMIEVEAAESAVLARRAEPSGTVRITASVPAAQFQLAAQLPRLAAALPKLQIQLHVTDRFVDLIQEGFDIALRSHFSPLPDSDLMARPVHREAFGLVAAPAYLAANGTPATPGDLAGHDGLLAQPRAPGWKLSAGHQTAEVTPRPRFFADESVALLEAAKAGLGITALPRSISAAAVAAGLVVPVLPEWQAGEVTTTVLTTHRRGQLPAVRAVVDFLAGSLRPAGAGE
ncbi:LysR family transcriptional regulator [Labrys sp. LIt4]|uniref:LysR substrate-binding domain-containing protein n=1 Tax=Labrys sp. LIt4 TaxID=2821355 RepID=UPI001AE04DAF|nr:LysR substrate-binding domain-containing protein [Labrys sp. LIt4]MBP0582677.1 LysR family transcriptional regulator [Labrys sp. LIt4]